MKRMRSFKRVLTCMLSATVLLANSTVASAAESDMVLPETEEDMSIVVPKVEESMPTVVPEMKEGTSIVVPKVEEDMLMVVSEMEEGTPKAGADTGETEEDSPEIPEASEPQKEDDITTGILNLRIEDAETGFTAQGDATFEGAVYDLFSAEGNPDTALAAYQDGDGLKSSSYAGTLETDETGYASIEGLYPGKYYMMERRSNEGYIPMDGMKEIEFVAENNGPEIIAVDQTIQKTVIKQSIRLVCQDKTAVMPKTGFVFYPESGKEPAVIGPDGQTELFLNEDGVLKTEALPYGTYTIHNTTEAKDSAPVEDFSVQIRENEPDTPQDWTILSDVADGVHVRIYKMDTETQKTVMLTGAKFKILDKNTGAYVSNPYFNPDIDEDQYEFEMTQRSELMIPRKLSSGNYKIEEVQAPEGYSLNKEGVEISVQDGGSFETGPDGGNILSVKFFDTPITGELHIKKTGEVLKEFTDSHFVYDTTRPLAGAVYEVHAAEDIYTSDFQTESDGSRTVKYRSGEKVGDKYTTNADGEVVVSGLLPGTYKVTEIQAPEGYVIDKTEKTVTFVSKGQDVPVVEEEAAFENTLRRAEVTVVKKEEGTDQCIKGAVFALYSKDDIKGSDGTVILGKDSKIEEKETGEDGKLTFEADIPAGYSYYIEEITPAPGYISNHEVKEFTFTYANAPEENESIPYEFTFTNKPMEFAVSVIVQGSGEMLPGASMAIKDADGNIVDQWVSGDNPYKTRKLVPGKDYILAELSPAPGYVTAPDVPFTVRDTTEAQTVEMENEVTKLEISKVDADGNPLPGAKLEILDQNGDIKADWTSESTAFYIEKLPIGGFTLHETAAPEGYKTAADQLFDVEDKKEIQKVVITNEKDTPDDPDQPDTPDEPDKPDDPDKPDQPDTPDEPDKPNDPDKPDTPNPSIHTIVEVTVTDQYTGKGISGASLAVKDGDGKVEDSWISSEEAHTIKDLAAGKTYTLTQVSPAEGYVTPTDLPFTVKDTADPQKLEMKADVTKVEISITDSARTALPGAKMEILDNKKNVVQAWTSDSNKYYIERLPIGKYTLREAGAPDGYKKANNKKFEVKDTADIQTVEMVNKKKSSGSKSSSGTSSGRSSSSSSSPSAENTPSAAANLPVSEAASLGGVVQTADDSHAEVWIFLALCALWGIGSNISAFVRKREQEV